MMIGRPLDWTVWHFRHARESVRQALRGPSRERDLLVQAFKSAGAATLAWIVAEVWLDAPLSFLAPWVALVMVHTTVYRSVVRGATQVIAVTFGVVIATSAFVLVGDRTLALVLVLVVMMPVVNWRRLGEQAIYAPLTAVLVITSGLPSWHALVSRLLETALGTVIGVGVNAFIFPPVHLRDARAAIDGLAKDVAGLLERLASGLRDDWSAEDARGWLRRAEGIRHEIDDAWAAIRWGQESLRLNPRSRPGDRRSKDLSPLLLPLEIVGKQSLGICRTLVDAAEEGMPDPDPRFVTFYADMLEHSASVVHAYRVCHFSDETSDLSEAYDAARERDRKLHQRVREDEFQVDGWLIHGPLLIEVDRLLAGLDGHEDDENS